MYVAAGWRREPGDSGLIKPSITTIATTISRLQSVLVLRYGNPMLGML
jgi:hypothetical protein